MIDYETYRLLWDLVDRRMHPNGFIYVGVADFFLNSELDYFDRLINLGFLEPIIMENLNYIDPVGLFGYREYPYILTTLGQIAIIWPKTVLETFY